MFIITDVPISSGDIWSSLALLSSVIKLNSSSIISDEHFATVVVQGQFICEVCENCFTLSLFPDSELHFEKRIRGPFFCFCNIL